MSAPAGSAPAYAELSPNEVLAALDAVGLRGDGRILQLNSYENRVFQVMLEDGSAVVAKFYRPGRWSDAQIVEEHAFALELAAEEVPVVPPLVLSAQDTSVRVEPAGGPGTLALRTTPHGQLRYAAAPRRAGRAPELEDEEVLQRLGGFIGRLHAVGSRRAFAHRHRFDAVADTRGALDRLVAGDFVPVDQQPAWRDVGERVLERIARDFAAFAPRWIRLHGDCHPGNLLWRDSGVHVVDLDDACTGPAVQDLWMLLSGEPQAAARQLRALLRGYRAFARFDERELGLIGALRLVRLVRHNAWVAQRFDDPAFPRAFPDFGSSAWWSQQCAQLRELLAAADELPTLHTLD